MLQWMVMPCGLVSQTEHTNLGRLDMIWSMSRNRLATVFAAICLLAGPLSADQQTIGATPAQQVEIPDNPVTTPTEPETPIAVNAVETDSMAIQALKKRVRALEVSNQQQDLRINSLLSEVGTPAFRCAVESVSGIGKTSLKRIVSINSMGEKDYCDNYACSKFDGRCRSTCRHGSECADSRYQCTSSGRCEVPGPTPPPD